MMLNFHMFRPAKTMICGTLLCCFTVAPLLGVVLAHADTSDDLVMALINKGVLTEEEGAPLLKNKTLKQDKAKVRNEVTASYADGLTFQTADQANVIAMRGRVEFDSRNYGKKDEQNIDTFDIRRASITLKGKINQYYDFNLTADFAQQNSALDEAFIGINWFNQAKFKLGQFDIPFGMEHLTSDLFIDFQERSFVDTLAPGKERGAMLHGAPIKGFYYGAAVSNGRGQNTNNQDSHVENLDLIARVTTNLGDVFNIEDVVYHVGIDYAKGDVSANQATGSAQLTAGGFTAPSLRTEGRGIRFFNPGKFSAALTDNAVTRTRYGLEGAYANGALKLQSEWVKHNYAGNNSADIAFDKDLNAGYISTYYMLTGESLAATYQPNGTWGRVKPKQDFSVDGNGFGAIGIGLRYAKFNAADFDEGLGAITVGQSTTHAQAWTAGVRWILNSHTHLVANYVTTHFSDSLDVKNSARVKVGNTNRENAITLRAQMDF